MMIARAIARLRVALLALALIACTSSPSEPHGLFGTFAPTGGFQPTGSGGGFLPTNLGGGFLPRNVTTSAFTGTILQIGDSNSVGAANYNATGSSDTYLGVSDTVGYAPVTMRSFYATGVTDPLVITDTGDVTLRAYAAPPGLNMGLEQSMMRRLYQRGVATAPVVWKWAVSGSVQHTHWRSDSTVPATGGNMVSQVIAFVQARQAATGRLVDAVVVNLGENDTSSSTNATPTATDIANMVAAIRSGLGRPTLPFFYVLVNSSTTGAFTSTVRAGQVTAIAADSYMRGVYSDDIVLASNPHYGASGYYDLGDRVATAIASYFYPSTTFNLEAPSAFPRLQDQSATYTTGANPATAKPRSGPDVADGDLQLLIATSQATDPTYALTTAAGFTALGSGKFQSIFSGTNYRTMEVWWRLVDQTTLNANNGLMPDPVLDPSTVPTTGAAIITIRGPNKWVANPVDCFVTGANNGNTTALTVGGCTTANANELAILLTSLPGTSSTVTASNSNISSLTKRRESLITQTTTIGWSLHTGQVANSNTVLGNTTFTMSNTGNNVGCLITIKP